MRFEDADHGVGDRRRTTDRRRPPEGVCCSAQRRTNSRRRQSVERSEGMCRHAAEQSPALGGAQQSGGHGDRHPGDGTETGQFHRVVGNMDHRAEKVFRDIGETPGERAEDGPPDCGILPQCPSGVVDVPVDRRTCPRFQWMGVLHLRPGPGQAVSGEIHGTGESTVHRQWVDPGAVVVDQTRKRDFP